MKHHVLTEQTPPATCFQMPFFDNILYYLEQAPAACILNDGHCFEADNQPGLIQFYIRSSFNEGLTVSCAKG